MTKLHYWLIVFCLLIIGLFYFGWKQIRKDLIRIEEKNDAYLTNLQSIKINDSIIIETKRYNSKYVLVESNDIRNINNLIQKLVNQVYKEASRAESKIDNDIDRLNLYMGIAIGLMTILGVFIPILTNLMSVQDLRDKQKEIQNDLKERVSINQLEELKSIFSDTKEKIDKLIPNVNVLNLQNKTNRFFYLGPILLSRAVRNKDDKQFINLLIMIKNSFQTLHRDGTKLTFITDNYKATIQDFILFLNTENTRFNTILNSRSDNNKFQELSDCLQALYNSNKKNIDKNYQNLEQKLTEIIQLFENRYAET